LSDFDNVVLHVHAFHTIGNGQANANKIHRFNHPGISNQSTKTQNIMSSFSHTYFFVLLLLLLLLLLFVFFLLKHSLVFLIFKMLFQLCSMHKLYLKSSSPWSA
jgi:quinol-cytochrome oxidoreductase complex cytochrome b subunit